MPKYRSPSHNRLLALEQELLEKKRWANGSQGKQKRDFLQREKAKKASRKRHTNNRLLQLEQDILGKYHRKKSQKKVSQAKTVRVNNQNSDRKISSKQKQQKSKVNRVKSQVFDTGEAIILQYKKEDLTIATPQIAAVDTPKTTSIVDILQPIQEFSIDDEQSTILSIEDLPQSPSFIETSVSPKIETPAPELPVVPEPVVSNSENPTETDRKTEKSLSQAAELISKIDTQSYPLQAEDLPGIFAELNSDRPETPEIPEIPVTPESNSESDRQNQHAIFDRLGKNMAYATTFDVGTIELEQLFDEFDDTLDRQEKTNQDNAIAQKQSNLELELRFDEFDRALDREEKIKTATEQTVQTESLPEILSEQADIKTEKESHNNSPEENSPLIFSIERSTSSTKSTPVDVLPSERDSLTGMPNCGFTKQNSYSSMNYPKPCDPPQETRNDSS